VYTNPLTFWPVYITLIKRIFRLSTQYNLGYLISRTLELFGVFHHGHAYCANVKFGLRYVGLVLWAQTRIQHPCALSEC
jgi:hypothetical protein